MSVWRMFRGGAVAILAALVLGLLAGIVAASSEGDWVDGAVGFVEPIGALWLRALQMTIVPLVVALLITGIVTAAKAARAGKLAGRALATFIVILWSSSLTAALLMPLLFDLFPLPADSSAALRAALIGTEPLGESPPIGEFVRGIVPTNPIAAAANDNILGLIVFTVVFGFAITRLPEPQRSTLGGLFSAIADAMLIVIGWVLALAPIGVAALAFVVGARAGAGAFGALLHYILLVSAVGVVVTLAAYVVAVVGGGVPLGRFTRAVVPAQAVAISTQSSLASLPAMLRGTQALGVPAATADIVLPLAVALFRATGPAMNLAVALYVAHWFGVELGPAEIALGIAAGAITTMGAVSLPGSVSFFTSIAPIALAIGAPIEPLALLIAVETIPDIIRTVGNVTMNVAVTATVSERSGETHDAKAQARHD
jgi:proton glutamate symport protein